jgi:hypothetical protein
VKRGLQLACQLAVAAWCAVLLASTAVPWVEPLAEELPLARVRPVLERRKAPRAAEPMEQEPAPQLPEAESTPVPEVESTPVLEAESTPVLEAESTPVLEAESTPVPAPEPRSVGASDVTRGAALLDSGGSFPVLSFEYAAFPSFRSYARAMVRLGARFVVVQRRAIVGSLDLETGAIGEFSGAARFSPRARDYTGEPGLDALARVARERFGERSVVMMLVPRSLDAGIFGGLARILEERGQRRDALREIRGRYERAAGGGVHLRVDAAVRRDGRSVPIETLFDLGQIVGVST